MSVADSLLTWESMDSDKFLDTFAVSRCQERYLPDAREFQAGNIEWQRKLLFRKKISLFGYSAVLRTCVLKKALVADTDPRCFVLIALFQYAVVVRPSGVHMRVR